MKVVLGRKQKSTHEDWWHVLNNIEEYVTKSEIDNIVEATAKDIRRVTRGNNVVYGWSGGKDSIALQFVMEQCDYFDCLMAMSNLEYERFLQWVTDIMPRNLTVKNTGQDLEWLGKNSHMLFPQDASTAGKWFNIIQQKAQDRYIKKNGVDIFVYGRRKADGNVTGKGTNFYETTKGFIRYSPLSEWPHEAILGLIAYYDLPLAPFYKWPKGFRCGTHAWPARQWTGSVQQGWKEVYAIDKRIPNMAQWYLDSAKLFLDTM